MKKSHLIDGVIYKFHKNKKRIYIPDSLTYELIDKFHTEYGHIRIKQMTMLITKNYYFPKSNERIKKFCDACDTCIKNKSRIQKALGQLSQLGPATRLYEIIAIDTVGGFANKKSKQNYFHIAIDAFTRHVWIKTSTTQKAKDFIRLIRNIKQADRISYLLCDLYGGINSGEFKNFLKQENIKVVFTTPDAAQSNGLVERVNQTLSNKIRCIHFEDNYKRSWTTIAHEAVQKYNSTPHTVTGYPPLYLLDEQHTQTAFVENAYEPVDEARKIAFDKSQKY